MSNMTASTPLKFIIFVFFFVNAAYANDAILFKSARIRYTTDSGVHQIKQTENLEYFDDKIVNGSQLRVTTDVMAILHEGAFRNMEKLQIIQLPNCKIQEIRPKAFWNVPNLDRIQLQDNSLSRIENGVFNFMNISQLFLQRNRINFIHSEAFDNMPNLHTIKLNANEIRTWDSNWFFNTPKLTEILIRRNYMTSLDQNAFKNIKKLQVGHEDNQNSTSIYLSKNKITTIHGQALSELVRLNNFYLDRNNLTEIPQNLFAEIESINYLNLRRNKIEKFAAFAFPRVSRFGILDLTRNELDCIPARIATQADKILLEDNFINCDCMNELKKTIEAKGRNNTLVVGDCTPTGEENDDDEDEDEEDDEGLDDEE